MLMICHKLSLHKAQEPHLWTGPAFVYRQEIRPKCKNLPSRVILPPPCKP